MELTQVDLAVRLVSLLTNIPKERLVTGALSSAEALARRAVALDSADAEARSLLCLSLWRRGDYEGALAEAERALATTPNLALAHHMLATGIAPLSQAFFGVASLMIAIPTAVQIFAWLATILYGRPVWKTPFLYVLAFFFDFILLSLLGTALSIAPAAWRLDAEVLRGR